MDCSPQALISLARCTDGCVTPNAAKALAIYLACKWINATTTPVVPYDGPIISDGSGGFCQIVVDVTGNVGAQPSAGPATATVPVLADGSGGFWQIITDASCQRGTTSVAGPATTPVVIHDVNNVAWTLIVDVNGNLGATS